MRVKVYVTRDNDSRSIFRHCMLKREIIFIANYSLQEVMRKELLRRKIEFLEERPKEVSLVLFQYPGTAIMNSVYKYVDRMREGNYQLLKYDYDNIIVLVPLEKNYYNSERKN